ncbi:MAG TPA: ATP-binding protein [Elusimicrobiota bacterium]|nr:ATP-binding protein [Elusimicrobiota bacterium]
MIAKEKIVLSWSGGKDSAMAAYEILKEGRYDIAALLTTVTEDYGRISMHGVRRVLLEAQARALDLPVRQVLISKEAGNVQYEERMAAALEGFKAQGVQAVAFGDIFLEDLRAYRENNLARLGLRGIFPLWKRATGALARDFIRLGFKAVVVCADTQVLGESFAGAEINGDFLARLPDGVDPCGENGEFHSFVYNGPGWARAVPFTLGERVVRHDRFCFQDIIPAAEEMSERPAHDNPAAKS